MGEGQGNHPWAVVRGPLGEGEGHLDSLEQGVFKHVPHMHHLGSTWENTQG